jgi:hypothetical protein
MMNASIIEKFQRSWVPYALGFPDCGITRCNKYILVCVHFVSSLRSIPEILDAKYMRIGTKGRLTDASLSSEITFRKPGNS